MRNSGKHLVAQKWAEEESEIEKFRAVDLEQAGIEFAQKNGHVVLHKKVVLQRRHVVVPDLVGDSPSPYRCGKGSGYSRQYTVGSLVSINRRVLD
ncbi:hypothetical protein PIB30_080829 [Stylosanthes scabra]|uniref:Uncharacterized protein n=1 Tax=Stylosanthes scabra TaxID=79078 RepID=A0ABU6YSX6_9FABA|nr:hypothetical protein [Stylosanthes scabra]